MNADLVPQLVVDARAELGEGPCWDHRTRHLIWVDINSGRLHRFDPATSGSEYFEVGQPVGAAVLRASGGFMLAVRDGFAAFDPETGRFELLVPVERDQPNNRMNDGNCDTRGRFWAGTMATDKRTAAGALYRLDPDRTVHRMLEEITTSNGIDWSPDDRLMYYVDTGTGRIDLFDFDADGGAIARRRPFVHVAPADGKPDGLIVDADGFVWVALWGGAAVHRYAPDGRLDRRIELPVSCPTKCAFGGDDLEDLYITTAATALSPEERRGEPHAGSLFRVRPGVRGRPARQCLV